MIRLLFVMAPLLAFGFSETNLPTLVFPQSVQPMDGANLAVTLDNQELVITNGMCALDLTFNSEPTQLPRTCFRFHGGGIDVILQPDSSTYPTNSNLDGWYSYRFWCPAPTLPPNARIVFRRQAYFGGPMDSGFGLDCSGFAFLDAVNNELWISKTNCTHRLMDSDGNPVSDTFQGGINAAPPR